MKEEWKKPEIIEMYKDVLVKYRHSQEKIRYLRVVQVDQKGLRCRFVTTGADPFGRPYHWAPWLEFLYSPYRTLVADYLGVVIDTSPEIVLETLRGAIP